MGEGRSTGRAGRRRKSIRLRDFDYGAPGAYFVTLVSDERRCLFGEVQDGRVHLNALGSVVYDEWFNSATIRFNVELRADEFIVMPNHVHGIVRIVVGATGRSPLHGSSPLAGQPSQRSDGPPSRARGPAPGSLGAFVGGFKSAATGRINVLRHSPGQPVWQRNYYEHVIRNEDSLQRIREYIINNPGGWDNDRENPASHRKIALADRGTSKA